MLGENPWDYADILCSLKHRPNVVINDLSPMVAKFVKRHFKNVFNQYEVCVAEDTPENIELASSDDFEVSFERLKIDRAPFTVVSDNDTHPVHMALFDRLHKQNTKSSVEALRQI